MQIRASKGRSFSSLCLWNRKWYAFCSCSFEQLKNTCENHFSLFCFAYYKFCQNTKILLHKVHLILQCHPFFFFFFNTSNRRYHFGHFKVLFLCMLLQLLPFRKLLLAWTHSVINEDRESRKVRGVVLQASSGRLFKGLFPQKFL